ncbi:MAG: DegT/DnrJ/EryC1/StrS family aminotransferase, partial [Rhodospirillales bacterium]
MSPETPQNGDDPEQLRQEILNLVERYHAASHPDQAFDPNKSPVPVSGRVYEAADMRSLVDSSLDFWLTSGRFNEAFELKLKRFLGARKALTVNSGSSANLVALATLTAADFG